MTAGAARVPFAVASSVRRVQVRRIGFVGARTADAAPTEAFFRDVLGLESVRSDPDWSILKLLTGGFDFVEVYGHRVRG